ncbi:uncharacterized protein LOC100376746 [Saccoglossus kowalevskii]|uniref:Uncharacterized protein LOC100376746 n=1 Tax=Saccoglossus kowalevskii TaxID=10224 RepID=A0ABM0GYH8_SACKO|nr:PREDICTED: uncharacterized protein LOC100376746 [Saccoglossus kowalevskii]
MSTISESSVIEDWTVVCVIRAGNICGVIQILMGFALVGTGLATFVVPPQISLLVAPFWAGFLVMICGRFAMLSTQTKTKVMVRNIRLGVFLGSTVVSVSVCSCASIFIYPMWMGVRQFGCTHNEDTLVCTCGSAIFPRLESCQTITGPVYSLLLTNLVLCSLCISTVVSGLLLSLYTYSIFIRHLPDDPIEPQLLSSTSTVNGSGNGLSNYTPNGTLQMNGTMCALPNGITNNNYGRVNAMCARGYVKTCGIANGRPPGITSLDDVPNGYTNGIGHNGVLTSQPRTCTNCSCAGGLRNCVGQETQI